MPSISSITLDCRVSYIEQDLAALETLAETHEASWYDLGDWGRWEPVQVTHPEHSTHVLSVDNGVGVIEGSPPSTGANDRVLYLLDATASDLEIRADFEGSQVGLAMRASDSQAIIVWNNIIFFGTGRMLSGVWEFDGQDMLNTNQQGSLFWRRPFLNITGDGSTVTVQTRGQHGIVAGEQAELAGVGAFGLEPVTNVPDAFSFQFSDSDTTTYTNGSYELLIMDTTARRRRMAARLIGNVLRFKQWFPNIEPEPPWTHPTLATAVTLPSTLTHSGGPPPSTGRFGFLANHLGDTGEARVSEFEATVLR